MARLVFMGRLEDVAGTGELAVEAGPVERILAALDPALAVELLGEKVRMALNGRLLTDMGGVVLGDGDELAFLPPVSGG
ncbi:molybdopterin synthase subunit MoaD [Novosphingobium aromaticivorans DSM 12444]|uniref:Molybdopterin synthase subunit MoaD n=1 Tax=Novosphingobium aromaticivorans (strain ATCC 700278 / DSM 12444 / CCUG 56034 / CIP 105152 / NBRC 16084 / F199) TaxID=279238 RepID=Q2G9V2_NOVAD|nr:MoaD/ThiS family protein [Novosphingobium aromaticivorans]ABD25371.1 molybdopterin synthase subunit MoaD [Novosphingobium aromaticivorans DSM 12444]